MNHATLHAALPATTIWPNEIDLDGYTIGYSAEFFPAYDDTDVQGWEIEWDAIDLFDADEFEAATGYRVRDLDGAREILSQTEWTEHVDGIVREHMGRS